MSMPDLLQAISRGDALQTSVRVATLLWVMGSKQHFTRKSRSPGLAEQDFKVVILSVSVLHEIIQAPQCNYVTSLGACLYKSEHAF